MGVESSSCSKNDPTVNTTDLLIVVYNAGHFLGVASEGGYDLLRVFLEDDGILVSASRQCPQRVVRDVQTQDARDTGTVQTLGQAGGGASRGGRQGGASRGGGQAGGGKQGVRYVERQTHTGELSHTGCEAICLKLLIVSDETRPSGTLLPLCEDRDGGERERERERY